MNGMGRCSLTGLYRSCLIVEFSIVFYYLDIEMCENNSIIDIEKCILHSERMIEMCDMRSAIIVEMCGGSRCCFERSKSISRII